MAEMRMKMKWLHKEEMKSNVIVCGLTIDVTNVTAVIDAIKLVIN